MGSPHRQVKSTAPTTRPKSFASMGPIGFIVSPLGPLRSSLICPWPRWVSSRKIRISGAPRRSSWTGRVEFGPGLNPAPVRQQPPRLREATPLFRGILKLATPPSIDRAQWAPSGWGANSCPVPPGRHTSCVHASYFNDSQVFAFCRGGPRSPAPGQSGPPEASFEGLPKSGSTTRAGGSTSRSGHRGGHW